MYRNDNILKRLSMEHEMKQRRVNMKDIAAEAGVSVATVSYIINGRTDQAINPATVKKVKDAVNRLGYVPNLGARALASRKTRLLGLVIPQTESGDALMFANSFYGEFLGAFELEARKRGYSILISGTDIDQSYVNVAKQRCLDGVVVVGMKEENDLKDLAASGIPVVLVDTHDAGDEFTTVNIDDSQGGALATGHLYSMGHRKIGLLTGYVDDRGINHERFMGYRDFLIGKGAFDDKYVYSGTVSFEWGVKAGMRFAKMEDRPTAVFATADILAAGFIKGVKRSGLRVPEDVSVMGFDDGFLAKFADPELTTIRQDVDGKGTYAAKLIIEAVEDKECGATHMVLPVSLVERESVKAIVR